jgi:hypothetical protein
MSREQQLQTLPEEAIANSPLTDRWGDEKEVAGNKIEIFYE